MTMTATHEPATAEVAAKAFTVPTTLLKRLVRTVAPAASNDAFRPILTGVLVELDAACNLLTLTGCDSYRIHRARVRIEGGHAGASFSALVPARWLTRWSTERWDAKDPEVTLSVLGGRVQLSTLDDLRSTPIIEGEYPAIEKFVDELGPFDGQVVAGFTPKYLTDVFKAAQTFAPGCALRTTSFDQLKPCRFELTSYDGTLVMVLMPVRLP